LSPETQANFLINIIYQISPNLGKGETSLLGQVKNMIKCENKLKREDAKRAFYFFFDYGFVDVSKKDISA